MELIATDKKTIFIIDDDDYDKIKPYRWSVSHNKWGNYIHARIDGKWVYLHRFIMNADDSVLVDHIDRNRMNNRKKNLRMATESNNSHNRRVGKNSESGIIGVTLHKRDRLWISEIMVEGKRIHLGYYREKDILLAITARLSAEKRLLGDFAPQRHLFDKYKI